LEHLCYNRVGNLPRKVVPWLTALRILSFGKGLMPASAKHLPDPYRRSSLIPAECHHPHSGYLFRLCFRGTNRRLNSHPCGCRRDMLPREHMTAYCSRTTAHFPRATFHRTLLVLSRRTDSRPIRSSFVPQAGLDRQQASREGLSSPSQSCRARPHPTGSVLRRALLRGSPPLSRKYRLGWRWGGERRNDDLIAGFFQPGASVGLSWWP
jgi:hypothetical protein